MKLLKIASLASALALAAASHAAIITLTDESIFDSQTSSLSYQDFSAGSGTDVDGIGDTLNTANATAVTGPVIPGLEFSVSGGNGLVVTHPGFFGTKSRAVGANTFVESLFITFDSGQTAVGLGLLSLLDQSIFKVSVFDTSNNLLSMFDTGPVNNTGDSTFLGLIANGTDLIGSINLDSYDDQAELVDMVKFGTATPETIKIPDHSSTAILAGISFLGLFIARRRMK
ncbi:VPDSG-CTERM sorting domain-containing protein [Pelagicoccus albus]|uniref:VPDSG-CTERM sorting domain-containing protein n=1 Tax=Pelagicoccus albus TaxID=415222 RepID=A0A7X1B861_9BACT|nr:VPDSG-CTERM sorting domain-containing protein [Pelagicoccus albus]MBC2607435.1 VPDSG-CTERM sorting domain-containing protein [Pelagicoccus albus]